MRNLHFTYNLSLDEQATLKNLNKFIKNNFGGKDGLSVPIKLDISNAITKQDIQKIQRQLDSLYANKLSLTASLKVNKNDIQSQAQTALDQASKNLKIKVGAEIDLGAIQGISELTSMVDTISEEVSRLKQNINSVGKNLGIDLNAQQTERQLESMLEQTERMMRMNEQSLQTTAKELEQTREKLKNLKEISKEQKRAMDEEQARFKEIAKATSDEDKQRSARIAQLERETEELKEQAKLEREKAKAIEDAKKKAKDAKKESKDLTSSINTKSSEINDLKEKKDLTSKTVEEAQKEKKVREENLSSINKEIEALRERIKLQKSVEDNVDKVETKTKKPVAKNKKKASEVENKINEAVSSTGEENKVLKEQANLVEYIGKAKEKNYKHELATKRDTLYLGIQENEATKVLHNLTIEGVKNRKTVLALETEYGKKLADSRGLVEKANQLIAKGADLTKEEKKQLEEILVALKQELVLFDELKGARDSNNRKGFTDALKKAEANDWKDDSLNKKVDYQAEKVVKIGAAYVYRNILMEVIEAIQKDVGVVAKADAETIKKQEEIERKRKENDKNKKIAQANNEEQKTLESKIRYPEVGSLVTDKIKNMEYEDLLEKFENMADGNLKKFMNENLSGIDYGKVENVIKNNERKIKEVESLIEDTTDQNIVQEYTKKLDKFNKTIENLKKLTNTYEEIDSMLRVMENSMTKNDESLLSVLNDESKLATIDKEQLKEYQQRIKDFMTWGVRGKGFADLDNNTKGNITWIEKDMQKLSANPDATIGDWELLMDKLKGYQEQLGVTENEVSSFVKKLRESTEAQREQKKVYTEQVAQGNEYESTLKRYLKLLDKESEEYEECRQALTEYTNARNNKLELDGQLSKMGDVINRTSEAIENNPNIVKTKNTNATKRKSADELIHALSEQELQDIKHQNLLGSQFKLISQITDAQERLNAVLKLTGINYDDIYEKNVEIFKSISDEDKIKALKDSLNEGIKFGSGLLSPDSYSEIDFNKLDLDNLNPDLDVTKLIASRKAIEEVVNSLAQLSSSIYGYGNTAESLARGVHEGLSEELTLKKALSVINDEHEKQDKTLIKLNEELYKLQNDPDANVFELKHLERKVSNTKELVDYLANAKDIAYERLIVIKDMKAHEDSELASVNKVVDARKEELEVIKEATTLAKSKDVKDYSKAAIDSLKKIKSNKTFKDKANDNPALATELAEMTRVAEIEKGSSKGIEYWEDYINKIKDFAINQINMKEKTLDTVINKAIMKEVPLVDSSQVKSLEEINELSKQQAKSIKQAVESREEQVERTREVEKASEEEVNTTKELVEVTNQIKENEEERNEVILKNNGEEQESLEMAEERLAMLEKQRAEEEEALKASSQKLEEGQKELDSIEERLSKTTELKKADEERLDTLKETLDIAKDVAEEDSSKLKNIEDDIKAKEAELETLRQNGETGDVYSESLATLERMKNEYEELQGQIKETEGIVESLSKAYEEQIGKVAKSTEEYYKCLNALNGSTGNDEPSTPQSLLLAPVLPPAVVDNSSQSSIDSQDNATLREQIELKQRNLDIDLKNIAYNKTLGESNRDLVKSIREQIKSMSDEITTAEELALQTQRLETSMRELEFSIKIEENERRQEEINKRLSSGEVLNLEEENRLLQERIFLYKETTALKMAMYAKKNERDVDQGVLTELTQQLQDLANSTRTMEEFEQRVKKISETFERLKTRTEYNAMINRQREETERATQAQEAQDRALKNHIQTKQRDAKLAVQQLLNTQLMRKATDSQRQAIIDLGNSLDLNADSIQEVNQRYKEFQANLKGLKLDVVTSSLTNQHSLFGKLTGQLKSHITGYLDLSSALQSVSQAFRNAFDHAKVVDEAFTNINQTMSTSKEQFQSMIDQANAAGNATGQLKTEVMEMMKVYAAAGETVESINAKLAGTAAFQNVTGLDGTNATNSIQTIVNQFRLAEDGVRSYADAINYMGDALVGVGYNLNKDETIAIREVVSAVEDAGAVIYSAGGSLEWYAALTGTLAEQMNATGSEVGGAMRMITARTLQQKQALEDMGESGDEAVESMANAEKALQQVGVSIRNSGGELRSIEEVLGDVAKGWDNYSDTTKQFVAEKLAGNNRRSYFIGIMENYQRVLELQDQALNSEGAMAKASEIQAESLAGRLNILANAQANLYETMLSGDTAKGFVDFATTAINALQKVVEFFDGNWSDAIAKVIGGLVTFKMAKDGITVGNLITMLRNAVVSFLGFETSVNAATIAVVSFKAITGAIVFSAIISGITALIKHTKTLEENFNNLSDRALELKQSLKDIDDKDATLNKWEKAKKELESLNEGTRAYVKKQDEVNALEQEICGWGAQYTQILEDQSAELSGQVESMRTLIDLQKREAVEEELGKLNQRKTETKANDFKDYMNTATSNQNDIDVLKQDIETAREEIKTADEWRREELEANIDAWEQTIKSKETSRDGAIEQAMSIKEDIDAFNEILKQANLEDISHSFENVGLDRESKLALDSFIYMKEASKVVANNTKDAAEAAGDLKDNLEGASDADDAMGSSLQDRNEAYIESLEKVKEARELLASITDGYDLDDMGSVLNSDIMSDYNGIITDSVAIQEHLNEKIKEMEKASNQAYMKMMADDKNFWNEKMKNSQEWATFEAGLQQNVTQLGAEMLGIQEQDFADFIDSKGGMRAIDLSNAETMNEAEGTVNMGMLNQMMDWYEDYINEKGGSRKVDMTNVIEFLNKQGQNEVMTINQLAAKWSQFYNDKKKAIQNNAKQLSILMNAQLSKLEASNFPVYDKYDMGYYDANTNKLFGTIQSDVKALQDAANAMENYFAGTSYSFDKLSGTVKQNSATFDKLTSPSSSSSSGGKDSSSKDTENEVENLELEIDRYYELNDAIKDLENSLSSLQAKREQITTKDAYKKSMEEEIALINKQIKAQQNLLKEQEKERNEVKSTLSKNGFKFDGEGDITNYASQLKHLQNQANKKSGEAKEAAIAQVKALADLIEKYNELHNDSIPSTNVEIQNLKNEITNLNKELEENMKAIEKMGDRYFAITSQIAKVDNAISMNEALQEHASDERKIELMKEQIALIKQRQELTKTEKAEAQKEANELKQQLAKQGITFNTDGQIANYKELIAKLESQANRLVGDAQDDAVEDIEELLDLINKYTELTNETIPELGVAWQDYANEMQSVQDAIEDIYREQKETAVQTQKDIASAYEKYLTDRYNKLKEALSKEKEAYSKSYEAENFQRELAEEQRTLDEIAQQIAIYERDTSAVGQARLEQLRKEYEEQQKAINDMIRENEKSKTDEAFDRATEDLDKELEEALTPENVADIVNQALASGFITIGDSVIELNSLMTKWIDETGDGLYLLGDTIKSEMIDNLTKAKDLIKEMDGYSSWRSAINIASSRIGESGKQVPQSISFEFNQPLVNIEGNADSSVVSSISDTVQSQLKDMEKRIYNEMKKALT